MLCKINLVASGVFILAVVWSTVLVSDAGVLASPSKSSGWKWFNVQGTQCGDGSPTGMAISITPGSSETVIFFDGGGACWDAFTCFQAKTASYVTTGYNKTTFETVTLPLTNQVAITSRNASYPNPYKKANFAYVPYCTGDLHAGDAIQSYPFAPKKVYHKGASNGQLMLKAISKLLPNQKRVLVSGASAGGYGSVFQYPNAVKFFPRARVDLLSDSAEETPRFIVSKPQWNLQVPKCDKCDPGEYNTFLPGLAQQYPRSRFAALSWTVDTVLPTFLSRSKESFADVISDYFWNVTSVASGNAKTFRLTGENHVVLGHGSDRSQNGVKLSKWLKQFHDDDCKWTSS